MTDPQYQPGECGETAGFLFSHRCGDVALDSCVECGKPICQAHKVISEEGLVCCTTCTKKQLQQWEGEDQTFWRSRPGYHSSPYFYRYHYYPGYYDPHDFTDSDEASLIGGEPGDAELFENDMGAS